jgi:hypothetical protein
LKISLSDLYASKNSALLLVHVFQLILFFFLFSVFFRILTATATPTAKQATMLLGPWVPLANLHRDPTRQDSRGKPTPHLPEKVPLNQVFVCLNYESIA